MSNLTVGDFFVWEFKCRTLVWSGLQKKIQSVSSDLKFPHQWGGGGSSVSDRIKENEFSRSPVSQMRTFCKKGLFGPFLLTFSLRVCRQQIFFPSEIKIKIHTEFIFNNEQILYSYSWVHIWGNQYYLQIKKCEKQNYPWIHNWFENAKPFQWTPILPAICSSNGPSIIPQKRPPSR